MAEDDPSLLDRPIPAVVLQLIGLVCLLVATAALFDGWYVIGALGIVLVFGPVGSIHEALVLLHEIVRRRRNGHTD